LAVSHGRQALSSKVILPMSPTSQDVGLFN